MALLEYAPFLPADAEQVLQASEGGRIVEGVRDQHLPAAQGGV